MKDSKDPDLELTDDEWEVVEPLVDEYLEKCIAGSEPDINDYLVRLPNDKLRAAFQASVDLEPLRKILCELPNDDAE